MPQISQLADTYFSQIFWMVIFFGLTFFIVGRGMVPTVVATVAARNQRIAADLDAAETARAAAEAEQAAWGESDARHRSTSHALIANAKHTAALATEARLAEAGARIEAEITAAETAIAAARAAALADFENVAADLVRDITLRVAGLGVSADEALGAVKGTIAHA